MVVSIHVKIFRYKDICELNLIFLHNSWDGVQWDKKDTLIFKGSCLEEVYAGAEVFYKDLNDVDFKRVRARMRHRLGRNGHGWPLTEQQKSDLEFDWTPIKQELKRLASRGSLYTR